MHPPASSFAPGSPPQPALDGTLTSYVQYALNNSPALRASFEEWRAAAQRAPQARRLPEPMITYGYFVRQMGPERHRIGISQSFPWPSKLTAGADAASLAARSAQRRYEAAALELTRTVAEAYWRIWLLDRTRTVWENQKRILEHFSVLVRGRLEVGQATLADLGQVDLSVARAVDDLAGIGEQRRVAGAALVAAIGAPPGSATPVVSESPELLATAESDAVLLSSAADHPGVRAVGLMAEAQQHRARAAGADAYPSFTLGVDYIETAAMSDGGNDGVMVLVGSTLPIWGGAYEAEQREARAESAAFRAQEQVARDQVAAELEKVLSDVRDAARRAKLHRDTLLPQAEMVYGSGLGAYQVDRTTLASVIMAQRDLLEIESGLDRALADHAVAWARLEEVVGRPVSSRRAP
jgi:cobalt-zinc-cadmium efflux system outer membrane protein